MPNWVLCLLSLGSVCHIDASAPAYRVGGPYYFGSLATYFIPLRPTEPLSPAQMVEGEKKGEPIWIAYFDNRHRITTIEHRLGGAIDRTSYEYFSDHFTQRLVDPDGHTSTSSYTLDGRLLDP